MKYNIGGGARGSFGAGSGVPVTAYPPRFGGRGSIGAGSGVAVPRFRGGARGSFGAGSGVAVTAYPTRFGGRGSIGAGSGRPVAVQNAYPSPVQTGRRGGRRICCIGNVPDTSLGFAWGPLFSKIAAGVSTGAELYGGYRSLKAQRKAEKQALKTGRYIERETVFAPRPVNWMPVAAVAGGALLLLLVLKKRRR